MEVSEEIKEKCKIFNLTNDTLNKIMERLLLEIQKGLSEKTHHLADVKCFVTYVQDLPNGNERGKYLALDLGGTHFRVLLIKLDGTTEFHMESKIFDMPPKILIGSGKQLFDYIAKCLAEFMVEQGVETEKLSLGFTFSFPLNQLGLTKGILVRWTKGFNCSCVENKDVVQLLKEAIDRRGDIKINVCAILNDTTGTLLSCAWKAHNCKIGLIVGTGSNACYIEKVSNAEMFKGPTDKEFVIINTEWGAFGENNILDFIQNEFDYEMDKHSMYPGKQIYEKMISGMYLGELVRLVIVKCMKEGILLKGLKSEALQKRGVFYTKFMSEIEKDDPGHYNNCLNIFKKIGLHGTPTQQDCCNTRYICESISRRAAYLVSVGIATLINKIGAKNITIGVDGSVYRFHPTFHDLMVTKIKELIKPDITFELMLSEDGSGCGAALVAAVVEINKK